MIKASSVATITIDVGMTTLYLTQHTKNCKHMDLDLCVSVNGSKDIEVDTIQLYSLEGLSNVF